MIFIGHSIQKQQNKLSSQVCMEYSPGDIISWVTNQALVHLRKLKLYQVSFLFNFFFFLESKLSVFIKILNVYTFHLEIHFQVASLEENLHMYTMKHIQDLP